MLPSRAQDWPHPAALTSPLLELSAFRLYANKGRGWRERKAEGCFVIKCMQHLSCCCFIMFQIQLFIDAINYVDLECNTVCTLNKRWLYKEQKLFIFTAFTTKFIWFYVDESKGQPECWIRQFTTEYHILTLASRWNVTELEEIWRRARGWWMTKTWSAECGIVCRFERKLEGKEICILRAWNVKAESSLSTAPESLIHRCTISNISKRPLYLKTTSSGANQAEPGCYWQLRRRLRSDFIKEKMYNS